MRSVQQLSNIEDNPLSDEEYNEFLSIPNRVARAIEEGSVIAAFQKLMRTNTLYKNQMNRSRILGIA
jgi:hypothetical protein